MSRIYDVVRGATVVITAENAAGDREPIGSGFFVAPGWVLSCAHVVAPARNPRVWWQGQELVPVDVTCEPTAAGADGRFRFPDAAVLCVPIPDPEPPYPPLSAAPPDPAHAVWAYGINLIRTGRPEPFGSLLQVSDAGMAGAGPGEAPRFLRLQGGQLGKGMSGGPVLDMNTFRVCGMIKAIQDEQSLRGGWAIPIVDALAIVAEPLAERNAAQHLDSLNALCRRQLMFGTLPRKVLALFKDHPGATDLLLDHLRDIDLTVPEILAPGERPEWAVRRLFDLDLDQLLAAILVIRDSVGDRTALAIFDNVACCLPATDEPAWWVAAEAASALRQEASKDSPRIVRVSTDEHLTVEVLMRRTFESRPWAVSPAGGPSSARRGGTDIPADTFDDIRAEILRLVAATEEEWAADARTRERAARRFRTQNRFLKVRVDAAPDAALLKALADHFAGVRFLISKRALALPDGIDDVLLDLVPPVDPKSEQLALTVRAGLIPTGLTQEERP